MIITGIADEAADDIEGQIAAHRELGWNHIELRLINGKNVSADAQQVDFDNAAAALEESGIRATSFASAIGNWSRHIRGDFEVDRQELETAIPRMKRLGVDRMRVMSWPGEDVPESEWRTETIRRLSELARIAEQAGIVLCHENCRGWGGVTAERMLEIEAEIGSPAFKLLYDIGNVVAHGQKPSSYFDTIRGHIAYVHVKDARWDAGKDEATMTMCGEGDAMVRQILETIIKEDGYDGVISIEPHVASVVHLGPQANKGPRERFDTYVKYGQLLNAIVKEITG